MVTGNLVISMADAYNTRNEIINTVDTTNLQ